GPQRGAGAAGVSVAGPESWPAEDLLEDPLEDPLQDPLQEPLQDRLQAPDDEGGRRALSTLPALVILEDPDARVDLGRARLGRTVAERMTRAARAAGFSKVIVGPKLRSSIPDAHELSVDDPVEGPALL